ncbi:radical SAM family heme chaperone HemW [Turicibacter sanguinis]|uniref:Heme chaperone HemW n=4 Tax=Turicibacter sanguinis TaxID=154288 RepID=A0A9X5APM3_9FIRM|nr:radical SAM family heme chaperone HemW [Turicibacter sanguinis]EFF65048.1 putative oxygen-independent coproporphyrinogen III oxidase [Turicibacter sanguinis PC909]MCU7191614.1 radical SAM family heme chaperone HemW [Turicibacter sanguinis]MCU7201969.1 radical SAM family heme chaperone HemW [Turicibacter sanguinis]MDB8540821.1 radical SAM family heme chaperone HemW [Turicibacter sanguinis]MDB8545051.1 radical SAM family heme chaperone HemW [Turicibacter sanguinis]
MPKGLYIHIPFCDHICTYCDFPKLLTKGQRHAEYIEALIQELKLYQQNVGFSNLQSIYIGGGTPTALSVEQIQPLFDFLTEQIQMNQIQEFSIEANPENLTRDKIQYLKAQGVNRFSLGVQTFHESLLKRIGRKHQAQEVIQAVANLKQCGIKNINLDLIYAIPGQTLDELRDDLRQVISLEVEHISAYSLIVEEHTQLYLAYMRDQIELTDNEIEAKMYEVTIETLTEAGYEHYEISNFAKSKPSLHNQWYWKNETYIGVGLGAHGYVKGQRYQNTRSINTYIELLKDGKLPMIESHALTKEEMIEEEMFLGLRLLKGVNLKAISDKYDVNIDEIYGKAFEELIQKGYLEQKELNVRLTPSGLLMANEVFEQFLLSI